MRKRVLVTGAAGFVGFHLIQRLMARGDEVVGIDNFNAYYNPKLKNDRIAKLAPVEIYRDDICNTDLLKTILVKHEISHIAHLAAQAGVRYSMVNPRDYVSSNLEGFVSLLEACRINPSIKISFASSSSVYGLNKKIPFSIDDTTDQPTNLYGATKKANEAIAHAYHHLYGMSITALRYFTAYGPWGRPDMAYYSFAQKIQTGIPIQVFGHGQMKRDFTYIDDIIDGTIAAIDLEAPFETFNLGNNRPVELLHLIEILESNLQKKAILQFLPMQPGEVVETCADIEKSQKLLCFNPKVSLEDGIPRFIEWLKSYESASVLQDI